MPIMRMQVTKFFYIFFKFLAAFTFLWFAHCIGDYSLQTKSVALYKSKSFLICLIHASVWTGIMLICFALVARFGLFWNTPQGIKTDVLKWHAFLIVGYLLLLSHLVIDYGKIYTCFFPALPDDLSHFNPFTQQLLLIDQTLHSISIIICYFVFGLVQGKHQSSDF
jgi:hypothetical protein